jgi:MFS family permease
MRRVFDFLRSDDMPFLARTTYRLERRHILLWGALAGLIEGNTSSIVAAKTFHGSQVLVAVLLATPMVANMLSLPWGAALRGRARRPLFLLLAAATALSFMSVGLTPSAHAWGGWVFAAQIAVARIFLTGLITARTSLWVANYPDTWRGRITGRLQSLRFLTALLVTGGVTLLFQSDAGSYAWAYPVIALLGLLSLAPMRRMPVRGERAELRELAERATRREIRPRGFLNGLREATGILRNDRAFARYCTAQFMMGSGGLLTDAVLTLVITKLVWVSRAGGHAPLDYFPASLLLDLIPSILLFLTITASASYFDRAGVLRFRVVNSAIWLGSSLLAAAAVAALAASDYRLTGLALALLVASRLLNGVGRSGGAIAWNLGHLHFAREHQADLYLGIHVALTGVRGVMMPFVALLAFQYVGWGTLVLACALIAAGMAQFQALWRESPAPADAPARPAEPLGDDG